MKLRLFTLFAIALMPGLLYAGTACATPTVVPADGRVVDFDFVANSGNNFYQFDVTKGNSYSVEVRQDYDDLQTPNDLTTTAFTDAGCTAPVAGLVDTTAIEPALPANSARFSFTAAASGTIRLQVANGNASTGRYVSVSVSDTTVFNPQFSTFSGFQTQYLFINTTGADVHGVLTVTPNVCVGAVPAPSVVNVTVPKGANLTRSVSPQGSIPMPANCGGFAKFTHDGPPGSVITDALYINANASVIVSAKFQPVRQGH
jgi:hypothetical protein